MTENDKIISRVFKLASEDVKTADKLMLAFFKIIIGAWLLGMAAGVALGVLLS